jgi:CHAD domain-containing protein
MPIAPERARVVFKKLERDLVRLTSKLPAGSVHSFRTGTRRLQTLLEDLVPDTNRNPKKLLKLLNQIRKRAGKVRDLDVQLSALRSLKVPQEPRRKTQLMQGLLELRAAREKKLRKSLIDETVRDLRKRLRRTEKELDLNTAKDPLAAARHCLERAPKPDGSPSAERLHQYRLLAKRARYTAEFASPSPQADQFIAQLRQMQDALGDWHDWQMLTQSAIQRLGDLPTSPLVAMLQSVTGAKSHRAVAALAATETASSTRQAMNLQQKSGTSRKTARTPQHAPAA